MTKAPIRVLVAEDDDDHAELLIHSLERTEILGPIERVQDGEAVLRRVRAQAEFEGMDPPQLLLLDLNMPRLGGIEVLESIRADRDQLQIPIVVFSTSSAEHDRSRAYAAGASSFLVKPMGFQPLKVLSQDLARYWGQQNLYPGSTP